jgi:hypothetical protein
MKKIIVTLENGDDNDLFGVMEGEGFFYTTAGNNEQEVSDNLKDLLTDFLENEGKEMKAWEGITADQVEFEFVYDLTAFFDTFEAIKINSLAKNSGINQSLMRQYATGSKQPSIQQAKKIEAAIHQLGQRLMKVRVC